MPSEADRPPWDDRELRFVANLCDALSEPTRLRLFILVCEQAPVYAGALVTQVGLSQATVSRHMSVLVNRGLVAAERRAQRVYYEPFEDYLELLDMLRSYAPSDRDVVVG
jgi:DNA-binding transcriptional ArsR family regulator